MPSAERAYFFRHAILQRAAYELQPPSVRSRLHALALDILEKFFNPPPRELAAELADHAGHAARYASRAERYQLLDRELSYLRIAAEHAMKSFRSADAARLWRSVTKHARIDASARIDATLKLSRALRGVGDLRQSLEASEQALALARKLNDAARIATGLQSTATLLRDAGRRAEAIKMSRRALAEFERLNDKRGQASACGGLALALSDGGESNETLENFRRSIALSREIGDVENEAFQNLNLGATLLELGDYPQAEADLKQALAQFEKLGFTPQCGVVYLNLAVIERRKGKTELALPLLNKALDLLRQTGHRRMEAQALNVLANIRSDEHRRSEARKLYEEVLQIHRDTGNIVVEGRALTSFAQFLGEEGELGRSLAASLEARRLLEFSNDTLFRAMNFGQRASFLMLVGRFQEAQSELERGFSLQREAGLELMRCHHLMLPAARLALARGYATNLPGLKEATQAINALGATAMMGEDATLRLISRLLKDMADEQEQALKENRRPMIFRGFLPRELNATMRLALLKHMQEREPREYAKLAQENPALLQAMQAGHENVTEPDWRNELPI